MNEDFEQRLRAMLAASEELPVDERFGDEVRRRIAQARRRRRLVLMAAATAAGIAFVVLGAPLLAAGTMAIAEVPALLNGALSALLVSPAGYLLGAVAAAAAVAGALTD